MWKQPHLDIVCNCTTALQVSLEQAQVVHHPLLWGQVPFPPVGLVHLYPLCLGHRILQNSIPPQALLGWVVLASLVPWQWGLVGTSVWPCQRFLMFHCLSLGFIVAEAGQTSGLGLFAVGALQGGFGPCGGAFDDLLLLSVGEFICCCIIGVWRRARSSSRRHTLLFIFCFVLSLLFLSLAVICKAHVGRHQSIMAPYRRINVSAVVHSLRMLGLTRYTIKLLIVDTLSTALYLRIHRPTLSKTVTPAWLIEKTRT